MTFVDYERIQIEILHRILLPRTITATSCWKHRTDFTIFFLVFLEICNEFFFNNSVTITMPSHVEWFFCVCLSVSFARNIPMFSKQVIFMILFITFFSLLPCFFFILFIFANLIWNVYCNGFDWNDYYRSVENGRLR